MSWKYCILIVIKYTVLTWHAFSDRYFLYFFGKKMIFNNYHETFLVIKMNNKLFVQSFLLQSFLHTFKTVMTRSVSYC